MRCRTSTPPEDRMFRGFSTTAVGLPRSIGPPPPAGAPCGPPVGPDPPAPRPPRPPRRGGSRIAFCSNRKGVYNIYWKLATGSPGSEELLLETTRAAKP